MDTVFRGAEDQSFSRGEEIPVHDSVHYIREGYVGLYGQVGRVRRLLFVYKKGDIIPMFDGTEDPLKRVYVYVAMKRLHVRTLPREKFEQSLAEPNNSQAMLHYTRTISELQFERINNMQQTQVLSRLIERLLFFSRRLGQEENGKIKIDVPLSHVDIATSIGATRETVNRYMRQLEDRGLIQVRRQRITINAPQKLQQLLYQKDPLSKPNWILMGIATAGAILTQTMQ